MFKPFRSSTATPAVHDITTRLLRVALLTVPLAFICNTLAARADAPAGSATVLSGQPAKSGVRVAVVSATDAGGDPQMAQRAIVAATEAVNRTPGMIAVSPHEVSDVVNGSKFRGLEGPAVGGPLVASDYKKLGKQLKAPRALDIAVAPGAITDGSATYSATAEMYDTKTGALIGHSQASATTATADVPTGRLEEHGLSHRALYGAVNAAIMGLTRTAQSFGVVASIPGNYITRISLGELQGVRQGARVEYWANGQPFAFGNVIELNLGESLASVAPETAFPAITINTEVHVVSNPTTGQAGPSNSKVIEEDYQRFERNFAIGLGVALAYYYGVEKRR